MTPEVVAKYPQEVRKLTREFKEAGAEVLQTLTFFGTSNMLAPAGLGDRAEEINRTACRIAREAGGGEALVAGNLNSPSIVHGDYNPADKAMRERTRGWLDEQLPWLVDEGVDFLIMETFSWLDEALVALEACVYPLTIRFTLTEACPGEATVSLTGGGHGFDLCTFGASAHKTVITSKDMVLGGDAADTRLAGGPPQGEGITTRPRRLLLLVTRCG